MHPCITVHSRPDIPYRRPSSRSKSIPQYSVDGPWGSAAPGDPSLTAAHAATRSEGASYERASMNVGGGAEDLTPAEDPRLTSIEAAEARIKAKMEKDAESY